MAVEITDASELQAMASGLADDYEIVNDIDASGTASWNSGSGFAPVGSSATPFTGTLDGLGNVVSTLTISRSSTTGVGMFGRMSGTCSNLLLASCSISGGRETGAFAGRVVGTIQRCASTGSVTGGGFGEHGGIAGVSQTGANTTDTYSRCSVSGTARAGGLIGQVNGSITRCYSSGAVSGSSDVGGLVGLSSIAFTGTFWDTETSGQATSSGTGSTGRTTAQMKTLSTFTGESWDIVSGLDETKVWGIDSGINDGYPFLQVFEDSAPPIGTAFWRTRQSSQLSTAGVIG